MPNPRGKRAAEARAKAMEELDDVAPEGIPRVDDVLDDQQRQFCREFLVDCNPKKAAQRCGAGSGWGIRQLENPLVCAEIARLRQSLIERAEVTVESIVEELAKIGFANAGDFFDWGPGGVRVLDKTDLTPAQTAAVAEVSETRTKEGGTIRVKLHDKPAALTQLGRHLGMFTDKVEVDDISLLSDEERAKRVASILDAARARRTGQTDSDQ